jgi:hypothetical protein
MNSNILGMISIPLYKASERHVLDKIKIGIPLTDLDYDIINEDVSSEFTESSNPDDIKNYIHSKYSIPVDNINEVEYPRVIISGL